MLHVADFNYHLPKNLIAQQPIRPRDHSRLLVLDILKAKKTKEAKPLTKEYKIKHKHFYDIVDYLRAGDVLVLNNSKVFPARLIGKKKKTGGKIEVFLHHKIRGSLWQCLLGGHGRKERLEVEFGRGLECVVVKNNNDGTWNVKFNKSGKVMMEIVEKIGLTPLPPYIKRDSRQQTTDNRNYQTVYADDKKVGSVAAPTAGFHFTPSLIKKLKAKGVQFEYITLHVGLGTFAPVKVDDITKHKMHAEWVEASRETIARIYLAKHAKRRIIAVGTTSVRTLEAIVSQFPISNFQFPNKSQILNSKYIKQFSNYNRWVDLFIYPGYKFKVVDAMITNFHLPKSTLLMLVSAFAGKSNIDKAYIAAISKKYRFYSYGDAMLIL